MNLQYNDIFSVFLNKITDYSFLEHSDDYIEQEMVLWLHSASALPRVVAKFDSLDLDDEIAVLSFDLKMPTNENSDKDFVREVLSRGMVIAWLEPQIKNVLLTKQMFGGKEEKFFAQSNHLKELQSVMTITKTELSKLLRDYGYLNNSYIKE